MPEAYIVDAVRSPVGKRNGGLSKVHPADLGAHSLNALMSRTGIEEYKGNYSAYLRQRLERWERLAAAARE